MVLNWDDILQGCPVPDHTHSPTTQGTPPTSTGNFVAAVVPCPSSGLLEGTTEAGKGTDKDMAQQLEQLTSLGIPGDLNSTSSCPRCNTAVKREAAQTCTTCGKLFHVRCPRRKKGESRKQTCIDNRQYVHPRTCGRCCYANVAALSQPNAIDPVGTTPADL